MTGLKAAAVAAMSLMASLTTGWRGAEAQEFNFGKPGDPIELIVAHPCCYSEVWSAFALNGNELWQKHLPKGSKVSYQIGLQGAVVVNQMLAGKAHIGYLGDLPALTAASKPEVSDIRIVGVAGMGYDQCYVFLVRKDAPEFKSTDEAMKWMNGKTVSTPKGSCTDDFVQKMFRKYDTKPASYLNQNIEIISSGFKSGRLDGASVWEPNASQLVKDGHARRIASGATINEPGGGFIIMQNELIKQRPDVVEAWLMAELEAQLWMQDPKNADQMIKFVKDRITGFSEPALKSALYGAYSEGEGGHKSLVRLAQPFGFTQDVKDLMARGMDFLAANKVLKDKTLRPEAVMPQFTEAVLKKKGITAPIGEIKAIPGTN